MDKLQQTADQFKSKLLSGGQRKGFATIIRGAKSRKEREKHIEMLKTWNGAVEYERQKLEKKILSSKNPAVLDLQKSSLNNISSSLTTLVNGDRELNYLNIISLEILFYNINRLVSYCEHASRMKGSNDMYASLIGVIETLNQKSKISIQELQEKLKKFDKTKYDKDVFKRATARYNNARGYDKHYGRCLLTELKYSRVDLSKNFEESEEFMDWNNAYKKYRSSQYRVKSNSPKK